MNRGLCLLSWSGGKDAAYALQLLGGHVDRLLTTYLEVSGNLPHADVPVSLVRHQAELLGLALLEVPIPDPWSPDVYAERMGAVLRGSGAESVAFGDLYLEELRLAREQNLAGIGVRGAFPCWTENSARRAFEIVDAGIEAMVVSVDTRRLGVEFLGRRFDRAFLTDLPAGVDACGEQGEFQTFVVQPPGSGVRPGLPPRADPAGR